MANRTIVPFGPQHPVLPEPIHLDLVLEDEKVVEAIPSIGFVHRGLEELAGRRDFHDFAPLSTAWPIARPWSRSLAQKYRPEPNICAPFGAR